MGIINTNDSYPRITGRIIYNLPVKPVLKNCFISISKKYYSIIKTYFVQERNN